MPGYTSPLHVIGRFILQSALQLLFAVFAPLWAFLWPIVCLLGVAFFIAGVVFVWRVLWNHTNETIWQLILGVALILGGFFYTTKVAIPLTLEVYVPGIIGFFASFISIFIKLFDLLL